jgi:hypothetical protein
MQKTPEKRYTLPTSRATFDHYSLEQTFTRQLERIVNSEVLIIPIEPLAVVQHGPIVALFGAYIQPVPLKASFKFVPIDTLPKLDVVPLLEDFYPSPALSNFVAKFDGLGYKMLTYPKWPKCHVFYDQITDGLTTHIYGDAAFPGSPEYINNPNPGDLPRPNTAMTVILCFQTVTSTRSFLFKKLSNGYYTLPYAGLEHTGKKLPPELAALELAEKINPRHWLNFSLAHMAMLRTTERTDDTDFLNMVYKIKVLHFEPPADHEWISLDALRWDTSLQVISGIRQLINSYSFHTFATTPFIRSQ